MSETDRPARWLAIVGIGEDGVEGLSPAATALVRDAGLVVGGRRHLALAAGLVTGETLAWPSPIGNAVPAILARRGTPVTVLATGDPFWFGAGSLLARHVAAGEMTCVPAPSAVSLAAARLGWAVQDAGAVSLCGRPLETLRPFLQPGRRLFVLSADAETPGEVARYLTERGFGDTVIHAMEALGGPQERIRAVEARAFGFNDIAPLNLLAMEVAARPEARVIPRAAGLPDGFFEHDGQITRSEVRAVTLSALAPRAGGLLWDIGCGSGSVAIEWLLADPANEAVAVEARGDRAARAARNACALGVPRLELVTGRAPDALAGLPAPDAVFVGGGGREPGLIETGWTALRPGGRIVANSVTLETDGVLAEAQARFGGTMVRMAFERMDGIGGLRGYRPAMTVTQWAAQKA